jgi:protoporphyrinogen IX oxidase
MSDILVIAYPWLKSLHVISVTLWMGAQFLLPSLLAAHRGLPASSARVTLLAGIERRLIHRVMNPAMLASFLFGSLLASVAADASWHLPRWLMLKLSLVFVLAALHGKLLRQFWRATDGGAQWTSSVYHWVQRINFALLVGIVVLVVARPFP